MISSVILGLLFQLIIFCVVFWLIFQYLLPLLPYPINIIVQVVCVILIIVWLLGIAGPGLGLRYSELISMYTTVLS